jgi:DNA-binding beta-propeller fold protein YncE
MRSLLFLCAFAPLLTAADFRPPAGTRPPIRRPGLESILPGGRMVAPLGRQFQLGPGAFGLAISPDGKLVATANGGPGRFTLSILDMSAEPWQVRQIETHKKSTPLDEDDDDDWRSVFMGLAFSSPRRLFAAEGNSGRVRELQLPGGTAQQVFRLNQGPWKDSYSGDLAFDAERNILYVVDQANFRVAIFDARSRRLIASVRTGRLPFKMALSPDRQRLYVTNIGMFEYKAIPGADPKNPVGTGLAFPAFGFPSAEAEKGARRDTAGGPVNVPGLGDPNVAESNSLCVIDVSEPAHARVVRFIRTGAPVGPRSQGGAGPSGVAAMAGAIYVSNGNQDSITVIDALTLDVRTTIALRIPGLEDYRGLLPIGLALDLSTGRLLVAEAGINAIGVVDLATNKLIAHLPAGWFPTAVLADRGQMYVASAKGLGTGPNATALAPLERSFQAELRQGLLSVYPTPLSRVLAMHSEQVVQLNGLRPRKDEARSMPVELRHVVIIVKENRTYDEIFGDVGSDSVGPLRWAPDLARFGRRGWVELDRDSLRTRLEKRYYNITPNHHAIAERFAFSDNFHADSEVSVDGHHWIVGSYPNAWTESSLMAAYAGQRNFRLSSSAPGRLAIAESNSSVHPEDQLEAGALWHHLERNAISFRNFGEGFELAGVVEGPGEKPTGARYLTNVPMPTPLYENTSRQYPQFNMNIPDQFRVDALIKELDERYAKPGKDLPRLVFIHLPNDHTAKPRPADGYPFGASYIADNDYALGRTLEYLSKSSWWKGMAVFITEDDAQGGVDHVDSHRTVLMVASPFARRNYASRTNASLPALLKTVFRILGIPPLNLYDATAADLSDCFTSIPDFRPFEPIRPDPEIFVPEKAKDPADPPPSIRMDDPAVLREQHRRQ